MEIRGLFLWILILVCIRTGSLGRHSVASDVVPTTNKITYYKLNLIFWRSS